VQAGDVEGKDGASLVRHRTRIHSTKSRRTAARLAQTWISWTSGSVPVNE